MTNAMIIPPARKSIAPDTVTVPPQRTLAVAVYVTQDGEEIKVPESGVANDSRATEAAEQTENSVAETARPACRSR